MIGKLENPYVDSPSYYYLHITDAFLQHYARRLMAAGNDLHQSIPKLFLEHALKTTVI
jgi:hypothetical protein